MENSFGEIFTLVRPERFSDTTRVFGSRLSLVGSEEYGLLLFSGFVFRADTRPPDVIFRTGFSPRTGLYDASVTLDERMRDYTGSAFGTTGTAGVSTTVCAHAARYYNPSWMSGFLAGGGGIDSGYIYLIDARFLTGYAIRTPRPNKYPSTVFPILRFIYEVNFTHTIPATHIVGVVWSSAHAYDGHVGPVIYMACWFEKTKAA